MSAAGQVSLSKVRRSGKAKLPDNAALLAARPPAPTLEDLTECLHFALGDGRIWLNNRRAVLLQTQILGRLRAEIIAAIGETAARALFTRIGAEQGRSDAVTVRDLWPQQDLADLLAAGPRLHTLEGFVKVTTVRILFDVATGRYDGEFLWHDSSEADEHLATFGPAAEPTCWMQTGYASGYVSELLGIPIVFREVECRGSGAARCRCLGREASAWSDIHAEEIATTTGDRRPIAAGSQPEAADLIGQSASFRQALSRLEKAAATDASVLLLGESGVGKELFSRRLHQASRRRNGPFIAVNCAALPENLMEAELFGVEKGAFTGAQAPRPGRFERADGGTLFLDEIAALSLAAQAKLLRALQERQIDRVGGTLTRSVNVRVVAASNVDLKAEVLAGRFREDLYYRLNVVPIDIPALRDRRDDLPLLIAHFLKLFADRHGRSAPQLTSRAMAALLDYAYPGNVRELQNLIERGVIFADETNRIDVAHLFRQGEQVMSEPGIIRNGRLTQTAMTGTAVSSPVDDFSTIERDAYARAMEASAGKVSAAARLLGLTRSQLEYRLKKHGML